MKIRTRKQGGAPVAFDCPWRGHAADPGFQLRNSSAPDILGLRCVKCGCLFYVVIEVSAIVDADGQPTVKAPEGKPE